MEDLVAEMCAICERGRLVGGEHFIAGPLPSDPLLYVGSKIVICPDCLPKKREREGRRK